MTLKEAIQFAIEKLSNERDREFDGADVSGQEQSNYSEALRILGEYVS